MVGDVKQSIYRFRLAEPGLFLGKYKRFTQEGLGGGMKIDLAKNFRSRHEVLAGTNFIFKQIMGEEVGEIDYDADAELKLGATYPEGEDVAAELLCIQQTEEEVIDGEEGAEVEKHSLKLVLWRSALKRWLIQVMKCMTVKMIVCAQYNTATSLFYFAPCRGPRKLWKS